MTFLKATCVNLNEDLTTLELANLEESESSDSIEDLEDPSMAKSSL